jgi:hypothetical protein
MNLLLLLGLDSQISPKMKLLLLLLDLDSVLTRGLMKLLPLLLLLGLGSF